ncbi:MAG: 2-oxo acid dehydrogenase subunit E2, partial [Oligoflexia bacterium]|nr:2-oxo acid dehydrogenase subunit E2 [Oligoflexia bacterium]
AQPAAPPLLGLPPLTWAGTVLPDAVMEPPRVYGGPATPQPGSKPRSSPASRHAARSRGLDIGAVPGTGPRGRVTVADVGRFTAPATATAAAAAVAPGSPAPRQVKNSQMRKTIARRLSQAYLDAPSFFLTARFDCDRLVDFRAQLKQSGLRVSFNDILVKAVAMALREVPEVNASWGDQAITRHGGVHVGIAVAIPDGLVTPVIRDADRKGLEEIARQTRDLAQRARDRKLQPDEYQGSTFTISNLGMMEIEQFTAIINPPESAILAVGSLQQEPVVRDGKLVAAWQLRVTMTCDHRVIDGALGARFLQAVRRTIEHPAVLAR